MKDTRKPKMCVGMRNECFIEADIKRCLALAVSLHQIILVLEARLLLWLASCQSQAVHTLHLHRLSGLQLLKIKDTFILLVIVLLEC